MFPFVCRPPIESSLAPVISALIQNFYVSYSELELHSLQHHEVHAGKCVSVANSSPRTRQYRKTISATMQIEMRRLFRGERQSENLIISVWTFSVISCTLPSLGERSPAIKSKLFLEEPRREEDEQWVCVHSWPHKLCEKHTQSNWQTAMACKAKRLPSEIRGLSSRKLGNLFEQPSVTHRHLTLSHHCTHEKWARAPAKWNFPTFNFDGHRGMKWPKPVEPFISWLRLFNISTMAL